MKLRYHPGLSRFGAPGWPPVWIKVSGDGIFDEESAILASATLSRLDPPTACYLLIENGNSMHMGTLSFEDGEFGSWLCQVLQSHVGKPIKAIAEIDLPSQ